MARAALKWSYAELARHSGVASQTIHRYEQGSNATVETLKKLKQAFEAEGVTWVPENGGPAGIRPPKELAD